MKAPLKLKIYFIVAFGYAVAACLLLNKISPEGAYKSWDTTRFLVWYLVLSFVYLVWLAKFLKEEPGRLIAGWIGAVIIFSLAFCLIKTQAVLFDQALTLKFQRVYFLLFYAGILYTVFYWTAKNIYRAVRALKGNGLDFSPAFYLTFHYMALAAYFIYAVTKLTDPRHLIMITAAFGACGAITLAAKNKKIRDNLHNVLGFIWQEKRFIFLIVAFALGIRVLFAVSLTRNLPEGMMGGPDSLSISQQAKYLAETGDLLSGPTSFLSQKGAVILFYASIYKVFGYSPLVARLFNALLGAASVIFAYYIARFIFNATAAKIAAFLTAGYGFMIQYGVYIGSEALGLFTLELFILGVVMAVKKIKRHGFSIWPLAAGAALALTIMCRPEYYYAVPVIFLWVFYVFRKKKGDILFFFAGFLMMAAPWIYRNMVVLGEPVMSSLLTSKFKGDYMGGALWHYEITKFAEAGLPVKSAGDIIANIFLYPSVSLGIILPHILKGIYSFWDYNTFFSPAFVFIEPKTSAYNMVLCFYLYSFMIIGFLVSRGKFSFTFLLLFLVIIKTVTYVFTTSPTFWDGVGYIPELKDWYRFTVVPLTHIVMGGGIAYLISRIRWKHERYSS